MYIGRIFFLAIPYLFITLIKCVKGDNDLVKNLWGVFFKFKERGNKGLFINDVINFGGYCDPPPPLVIIRHLLAYSPPPPQVMTSFMNSPL